VYAAPTASNCNEIAVLLYSLAKRNCRFPQQRRLLVVVERLRGRDVRQ
jgi:hypothetical protein